MLREAGEKISNWYHAGMLKTDAEMRVWYAGYRAEQDAEQDRLTRSENERKPVNERAAPKQAAEDPDGLVFYGTGPQPPLGYDPVKGLQIVAEAETYEGTPHDPERQPPVKGVGGECCGITEQVLVKSVAPGFSRGTTTRGDGAQALADSPSLVKVPEGLAGAQPGDVLVWKENARGPHHLAFYAGKSSYDGNTYNDMIWTTRTGARPYALVPVKWFRRGDPPVTVLRARVVTEG